MRILIRRAFFLCAIFLNTIPFALSQDTLKVACIGNSITEGYGLSKPYPRVLQELLGSKYKVRNFGVGGRTLLKQGDFPYWNEAKYQDALDWQPNIVIIKLGTNDSKPQNWRYREQFIKDYEALIESFKQLPSKPVIYICLPIPVFEEQWGINDAVVKYELLPAIKKIAQSSRVNLIDLYSPMVGRAALTYDGIHPNDEGAALLAREILKALQLDNAASVSQ